MGGNDAKKSGFRPYKRFLLSLGGLSSAVESLFVLFGYAYLRTALPPYLAALIAVIAAAAAIALVPVMHATVNRVRSLTLGRYHGMLVLASVLASLCVAFVGIIGFVGLVVPHLCRMVLGGDHRLVLPSSIAFGGFLMMAADLASRMLLAGIELPVGAITTLIGVPVFAWLLIRKGRMYDG